MITISNLRYGVDLPDTLFQRAGLARASQSPVWKGLH